ncbi:helicase-related protein [Leifsonia sp. P73]|uniref:helicase-related protein n=1 Tax=Leifsonia sp. P73 TaxID=3423959 RepID=UPI003DA2687D
MTLTQAQAIALEQLRRAYVGPEQGENEVLTNRPSLQYAVGMLFPALDATPVAGSATAGEEDPHEFVDADVEEGDVEEQAASVPLAEDWRPSSAAISFITDADSVMCDFSAATYAQVLDDGPARWQRYGRSFDGIALTRMGPPRVVDLDGVHVQLGSRWRTYGDRWLVTVHTRLLSRSTGDDRADIPLMLFQVSLAVRTGDSSILEYDVRKAIDVDEESRELRLRYRDRKVFAVGHGMAADWDVDASGRCTRVFLDPVPAFVVPAIEQTGRKSLTPDAAKALDLSFLERVDSDPGDVAASLNAFVDCFGVWVKGEIDKSELLGDDARNVARRSAKAEKRMRRGVDLLFSSAGGQLRTAFALAMSSMRMQMRQAALARGDSSQPAWRPFQLGFLLVSLASTIDENDDERELVDLIWFPTGGGKTEAYLGLAAIQIFLRRLMYGAEGAGTAVITRYTLRLLTSQQFQRAAALVCAMELLRETDVRAAGMARFTIGLWVGSGATPNTRDDAKHSLDRLYKARRPREANEFQITECPWCLTELVPEDRDDSGSDYGAQPVGNDVVFFCLNKDCPFSARELPMAVVDDVLYEHPPTILLATVDKFARLQFDSAAGRLLGIGMPYRPPSLIIQDELHLLSGPLGTTVAVFDAVIQVLLGRAGSRPKIIASTATIRSSAEQVEGLYGRSVALYPPAGLSGDATFFSRPVENGEGRLYIGLMPQSVSQATALVLAASPLIEIPDAVVDAKGIDGRRDPYWTAVMYHNSLRELGRSSALLLDDINGRIEARADRLSIPLRRIRASSVLELTSRRGPEELPNDLRRLRQSEDESTDAVDVVLSSNMLSVGIDVQRLALMLMVGQPKTTAEYIQATSRVGRGDINGIVVTLFRSNRARDRSHFETFRGYHDALYRSVEPTSVTPWSLSSRDRSLAGALVALLRHSLPSLAGGPDAVNFDLDDTSMRSGVDAVVSALLRLVEAADRLERADVEEEAWRLLRDWDYDARAARRDGSALSYERGRGSEQALLKRFGQPGPGWLVGDSMRSVEPNVTVEVQEEVRSAEDPA